MQARSALRADWRDAAAYAPLRDADRSLFAWEWLRRDPSYIEAALSAGGHERSAQAARFGLVSFEPPDCAVPDARPLWRSEVHPGVLEVHAGAFGSAGDRFDHDSFGALSRIYADDREHLLLCDGLRCIRLDGSHGTFTAGPKWLGYTIGGIVSARPPLMTLRRLLALCATGHFSPMLHPREARARRWTLALRAFDAIAAGAGQRDIAELLLRGSVSAPRWRSREPSIRSQAQRLVHAARSLANGGYRALLR